MKQLMIIVAALLMAVGYTNAQVVRENEAAVVYYMPKTELVIHIDYEVVTQTPGVFYQYAERYLGAQEIIMENNTNCQLRAVRIATESSADTERAYKVTAQKGINTQLVSLSEDGRLVGYGIVGDEAMRREGVGTPQSLCDSSPINKGAKRGERLEARGEELMPLLEEQFMAGSVAKMADGAAKQIYRIRETRLNILAGDVEHVPADGKAMELVLNELDKQEQALVALFVGKTQVTHHTHAVRYVPGESVEKEVVCRLSAHNGIVDKNDLSGEPLYLTLVAKKQTLLPAGIADKNTPLLSQIHYNLPGEAKVTLTFKGKKMAEQNVAVAQYGVAIPLAQELFTGKTIPTIKINAETGNILEIRK